MIKNNISWHAPLENFNWVPQLDDNDVRDYGDRKIEMTRREIDFLAGILKEFKPHKILEVGVAAGGTTTILLHLINYLKLETKLYSIDINEQYYANAAKKVGYMTDTLPKEEKRNWELFTGNVAAEFMPEIGGNIDLCILDTAHSLPGELLDFLCIYPFLKEGSIVVLHDTALNMLGGHDYDALYATRLLLSLINGDKIELEDSSNPECIGNIACFKVTRETVDCIPNIFAALNLSWSYLPEEQHILNFYKIFYKYYNQELIKNYEKSVNLNFKKFEKISPFKNKVIDICFSFDDKYVDNFLVCLTSILINSHDDEIINIYVLTVQLEQQNISKILSLKRFKDFKIEFINISKKYFANFSGLNHITQSTYYRLIIPQIFKDKNEKILYLDCDIIVNNSLFDLYSTDIDEYYIAAVEDFKSNTTKKFLYEYNKIFKIKYFNAGVLLYNIRKTNDLSLFEKSCYLINRYGVPNCVDQDLLNSIIPYEGVKWIEFKYNNQIVSRTNEWDIDISILSEFFNKFNFCDIIHFVSDVKPWNISSFTYAANPFVKKFYYYKRLAGYSDKFNYPLELSQNIRVLLLGENDKLMDFLMEKLKLIQYDCEIYTCLSAVPQEYLINKINNNDYNIIFIVEGNEQLDSDLLKYINIPVYFIEKDYDTVKKINNVEITKKIFFNPGVNESELYFTKSEFDIVAPELIALPQIENDFMRKSEVEHKFIAKNFVEDNYIPKNMLNESFIKEHLPEIRIMKPWHKAIDSIMEQILPKNTWRRHIVAKTGKKFWHTAKFIFRK